MTTDSKLANFSWVEINIIAGSSIPRSNEDFQFLLNQGIKVIINLTENPTYQVEKPILDQFILHHISIADFTAPTLQQIDEFQNLIYKYKKMNYPVLVHCYAGCGRTGTFLTAFLMFTNKFKTAEDALMNLRKNRSCSVETDSQLDLLNEYEIHLQELNEL